MSIKLRTQLTSLIAINMLVSLTFFCVIYYRNSVNLSIDKAMNFLQISGEKRVSEINAFFDDISDDLRVLAKSEFISSRPEPGSSEHQNALNMFRIFTETKQSVKDYYAGYSDGIIVLNNFVRPEGFDPRNRDWYIDAQKQKGRVCWGNPYTGVKDNEIMVSGSLSLPAAKNGIYGVVSADCTIASLNRMIKNTNEFESSYSFIINQEGVTLLHPDSDETGSNISSTPLFKSISGDSGITEYDSKEHKMLAYFTKIKSTGWILFTVVSRDEIYAPVISRTVRWILVIMTFNIIVSILFFILLNRKIVSPLSRMNNAVGIMTGGDLTHQIGINSHTEIGELSSRIDTFTGTLRNIIINMKKISQNNVSAKNILVKKSESSLNAGKIIESHINKGHRRIGELRGGVDGTRKTSDKLSLNIESLDRQVNIQAEAVAESSAAVEEMVASLKNVADIVDKKQKTIKILEDVTLKGNEKLSETNKVFKTGIADRISDITSMLEIIDDMAEMTNLLSMNAAIEAAHAGEAGKGFAVVADEIRKMATTSADNSKSINSIIKEIIKSIELTHEYSKATAHAFTDIEREINGFSQVLSEISSSTLELSAGSEQVLQSVSTLSNVSSDVKENSSDIRNIQNHLNIEIDRINSISSDVSGDMSGIHERIREIVTYITELNEITGDLGETADLIETDVNKFET